MENSQLARLLAETADLMEIAREDPFRVRSFRNAAAVLQDHPEPICQLARQAPRRLTDIPGIGKGLAAAIEEICRRGSFERRDLLLARYPPTALELLKIQGLGPKTIALLWEHHRVSTVDDLERLCLEQKLRVLPRLGARLEEKLLRSIAHYRRSAGRFLLSFADQTCRDLLNYLAQVEGLERITPAGSFRRGKETVGGLDLLVSGPNAAGVLDRFTHHPEIVELLGREAGQARARIGAQAIPVTVRALPRESFGAGLRYFTGSKDHNAALRSRALALNYSLSEHGLFRLSDESPAGADSEEEIYQRLGLSWIAPELRENQGEIQAAAEGRLPRLVELSQIRGDLHAHTAESDGRASLAEMAQAARALGYSYLAVTDHSKALAMANGLDEARVVAFARRVRQLNAGGELGIRILAGIECDIRRDGSMDLADDALAELDLVIGSVHSYLNLEPAAMTDRLLRALESPYLRVLGHPTGRLLLAREACAFDFERVAGEAARRGVWLEINASPERLDLDEAHLRMAKALGCRFVIATDAHHPRQLENMRYGVITARRGWLEAGDVLNTLSWEQFARVVTGR